MQNIRCVRAVVPHDRALVQRESTARDARPPPARVRRCVVAVCAPPALMKLSDSFPDLVVYAGGIDPELNDKGFIIPGLGDAGDRCFGT